MALLFVGFGLTTIQILQSKAAALTDCHRQPLTFSRLGPKSVGADFRGGRLTSDAGALRLREVGQRTGLFEAIDAVIPDPPTRSLSSTIRDP
jgi:hypothetical protein